MIYEYFLSRIDTIEALRDKVFPAAACVDDVAPPLGVYVYKPGDSVRDLEGEILQRIDTISLTLLGEDYDQLCELTEGIKAAVESVSNLDTGYGEYLFYMTADISEQDGFDEAQELWSRTVDITIRWCPDD